MKPNDPFLKKHGLLYSEELGIDVSKEEGRERWFIASILFGKRISEEIAKRTYKIFEKHGIKGLREIINAGWDKIVELLDLGGYARYDFSTATRLLEVAKEIIKKYGSVENIHKVARDEKDLERRLKEIKGIGEVTANIFLRELRVVWEKANPEPCGIVKENAKKLGIKIPEERKNMRFMRTEAALVRMRRFLK